LKIVITGIEEIVAPIFGAPGITHAHRNSASDIESAVSSKHTTGLRV